MGSSELYAHTPPKGGDNWQTLEDHLQAVAQMARDFGSAFGAGDVAYLAGVFHDVGKASDSFQRYLRLAHVAKLSGSNPPRSPGDHMLAGVRRALSASEDGGVLAIPILGHHGGMPDSADTEARLGKALSSKELDDVIGRMAPLLDCLLALPLGLPERLKDNLSLDQLMRMLFSCLVDADYLDTERHWYPQKARVRGGAVGLTALWERFEKKHLAFQARAKDTPVNQIRRTIYEACVCAADQPSGVFRLTVPTGGGKTRTGMAFALKHAASHQEEFERIIVAIPYTSIIDQNAKEYREILGSESVLEHHSAVPVPEGEAYSEEGLRMELAAENWDSPIIVTTTVQLFDSLFSNKPSKCRKLHSVAKSIIILDEVQTLPVHMLQPILDILKDLVAHYGVTLVLSTATQPALSGDSPYLSGFPFVTEIVPEYATHFKALERVEYEIESEPWSWERVAREMRVSSQILCIVNSRRDALALFGRLNDPEALHLSALMCPAHRRRKIDEIKHRLRVGDACRVVSTQVVEAGVDLDFPCVMRALGPLDRIIQAAGRCNREGKLAPSLGKTIVFVPAEGGFPRGNYAIEIQVARTILTEAGQGLARPETIERYFSELFQTVRKKGLDAKGINNSRQAGDFERVAKAGRMIDDDMAPIVVPFDRQKTDPVLRRIGRLGFAGKRDRQILQQYSVNVYRREYDRYVRNSDVREVIDGVAEWQSTYSESTGLSDTVLDPTDLVVGDV
jgi:CRISPR-associated endonuclease/helicase Cas3